jgi:hypothetical protein
MSKRVTYHYQQPTAPPWPQAEARPRSDLSSKLYAAAAAGIALYIILIAITIPIIAGFGVLNARSALIDAIICFVVSLIFGAALVLKWSLTVAERAWRVENKERTRRWKIEDEDRKRAAEMAEQVADEAAQSEDPDLAHIPVLAFEILMRHFSGQPTSRKECTGEGGICIQSEWNLVNRTFKALGLKRGYKLEPGEDLASAWAVWQERVKLKDGELWIRKGQNTWEIVRPPRS